MSTTTAGELATPTRRRNPYRGPREFSRGDRLPNREREARELADSVIADRVVLLHAPSGAGKTSLVEAAVVEELEREGFRPTPRLRVNLPPSGGPQNPYVRSLVSYLLPGLANASPEIAVSLKDAVERWSREQDASENRGGGGSTVLIIDQLEEVLIADPTDWEVKEAFFRELGEVLRTRTSPVWALLSMREDYMGGLDRYLRFLPGLLSSRYRLDFLSPGDAKRAMQIPSKEQHVNFSDEAAELLLKKLTVVEVQQPGTESGAKNAPYVEPFQLQVVCRQLWRKIRRSRGDDFPAIDVGDIEDYADIEQALTLYFGDTVAGIVKDTGVDEFRVREWFESELITKNRLRSQTLKLPEIEDPQKVLGMLEAGYLVRGDVRGGTTWYELTHDRLIGAVLMSNETWRWEKLEPWQVAAHEWNVRDRHPAYLLTAREMRGSFAKKTQLTEVEKAFLHASENELQRSALLNKIAAMSLLRFTAVAEAIVIVVLLVLLAR